MLKPFSIAFDDKIYEGEFQIGDHSAYFASGSSIIKFPKSANNYLVFRDLKDQGQIFLDESLNKTSLEKIDHVPIIGLAQIVNFNEDDLTNTGRIVVYGDSNCIDSSHIKKGYFKINQNIYFN